MGHSVLNLYQSIWGVPPMQWIKLTYTVEHTASSMPYKRMGCAAIARHVLASFRSREKGNKG